MANKTRNTIRHDGSGNLSRRDFLGHAAAFGIAAVAAEPFLTIAARAAEPKRGGILKVGLSGGTSTDSLDPATFTSPITIMLGRTIYEQLLEVSAAGDIIPRLAQSVEPSKDVKRWTFQIRKGVHFHNGKELTPADVVATIRRHSDKNSKSAAFENLRNIDQTRVDGDHVIFELKEPDAEFPYVMTDYHLMMQPDGGSDKPDAGIGTGPYQLVEAQPGVRYTGKRFEQYWDPTRGHADQVELIIINDPTARMSALRGGQVQMINRVEPKTVDLIKGIPGVTVQSVAGRGHYVFVCQCNVAPFDNNDLRLALKLAMDRQEMVDKILRGYGTVGNDFPINSAYPLFSDDIEQRTYDPDKAKFHFKKSGYDGPILLRTSEVAFPGAVDAAQLYQQSAAKAGIRIDVKREPGDGYWSEVWNKQPFCTSFWSGRSTQGDMYTLAYRSTAEWNETRFFRPDFDKMLTAARGELDQKKRKAIYREMAIMVRDEGGAIVPMFNNFIDATTDKVGGWQSHPSFEMMNGFALSQCWVTA